MQQCQWAGTFGDRPPDLLAGAGWSRGAALPHFGGSYVLVGRDPAGASGKLRILEHIGDQRRRAADAGPVVVPESREQPEERSAGNISSGSSVLFQSYWLSAGRHDAAC